jgi:potassium/hydrogen antiporter
VAGLSVGVLLLIAGALVLVCVLSSKVTERFGVPALLLFLGLGMLAGSDGPGGIYFDDAALSRLVGIVSLVLILYAGGLDTSWRSVRPVLARGTVLSTLGVLITAVSLGLFLAWAAGFSVRNGLLLGAVAASTDAAAVFAVLRARNVQIKERTRSLLELESGANDPTAVFLTIAFIEVLMTGEADAAGMVASFFLQMSVGAAIGLVFSKAAVWLINRVQLQHDGLYPVLSVALLIVTFGAADLAHGSGFLAVCVAGMVMGNSIYIHKRSLIRFHDGLAWLAQIGMFLTLGLLVFPSRFSAVFVTGLLAAAFLIFVARPLSVAVSLAFSRFTWREKAFISWVGLRGAAPIVLATFPLVAGVGGAERIFNIVFFVVLISVLLQGSTVASAARLLRVEGPGFRLSPLESDELPASRLVEYRVRPDSELVGRQIAKAGLPDTAKLIAIERYGSYLVPSGGMRLRRDDMLTIVADEAAVYLLDGMAGFERHGAVPPPQRQEPAVAADRVESHGD